MATTNKLKNSVDLERGVSSFNDKYFDQLYNKDQTKERTKSLEICTPVRKTVDFSASKFII